MAEFKAGDVVQVKSSGRWIDAQIERVVSVGGQKNRHKMYEVVRLYDLVVLPSLRSAKDIRAPKDGEA